MSNSARHSIRFFGAVYGASKGSYIDRCVPISIHMATTVAALKVLVGWFTNMFAYIAGLTRVPWINHRHRNTIKQSLVLQKQAKLSKRPPSKFGSKLFVSSFRPKPNISQVTGSNTFTALFSRKDNRLGYAKLKKLISDDMLKKEKLLIKGITAFLPLTKKDQWVSAVYL